MDYTESQLIFKDKLTQSEAIKAPNYPAPGQQSLQSGTAVVENPLIFTLLQVFQRSTAYSKLISEVCRKTSSSSVLEKTGASIMSYTTI